MQSKIEPVLNATDTSKTYTASARRYATARYARLVAAFAACAALGVLLVGTEHLDRGTLLLLCMVFAVTALVGEALRAQAKQGLLAIEIAGERITGPTGDGAERASFPLERVDTARSCAPNPLRWLNGHHDIWSLDGQRIRLEEFAFEPDQVREILQRAGCAGKEHGQA